jgi:hypothetical protein
VKTTCLTIIAACAAAVFLSGTLLHAQNTQQTTKGLRPAVQFNLVDGQPIRTQADVDTLTTGDTIAMVCSMCKSITMVTYSSDVDSKGHVKWMHPGEEMDCPQCGGKMTTVGGGEGKQTNIKHVCSKCGGESAFCCAFKTGQ